VSIPELLAHEIASVFPLLAGDDFEALKADIADHGIRVPIWLFEGKILDGRNRYRAARELGFGEIIANEFVGESQDALAFAWSLNRERRHLSASQTAIVDAERNKLQNAYQSVRDAAEARRRAALVKGNQTRHAPIQEAVPEPARLQTRDLRAKAAGTNGRYIDQADWLVANRPDIAEQVKQGEKTLTEVARQLKKAAVAERVKELPTGKFRVIYADPPWQYADSRAGLRESQKVDRAFTAAADHYPTMSFSELKALDVKSLAADDCVLLMWGTSPLLPEQIEIIGAWGFKYKTFFVWDKNRGSFGHYHQADAEILLVATNGSCTPDFEGREKQIQRWPRGEHSRKPDEARAMIDKLWPHGPRVELFCRGAAPNGWIAWGGEAQRPEAA
jgi:N6-adenosine-specific RNA methylase IME4